MRYARLIFICIQHQRSSELACGNPNGNTRKLIRQLHCTMQQYRGLGYSICVECEDQFKKRWVRSISYRFIMCNSFYFQRHTADANTEHRQTDFLKYLVFFNGCQRNHTITLLPGSVFFRSVVNFSFMSPILTSKVIPLKFERLCLMIMDKVPLNIRIATGCIELTGETHDSLSHNCIDHNSRWCL